MSVLVWMAEQAQQTAENTSGVSCRWLLVGACTPMAVVILALWRALEKSNSGRMKDLKENFKSVKEEED